MKITIYTPDGFAETFTDCQIQAPSISGLPWESLITFAGTNQMGLRVRRSTNLPYAIDPDGSQSLIEQANEILDKYETRGVQ